MATQLTNTSQVQFLHGTEASLKTLRSNVSNIKPGAFYVTSDTNRMYLGVQENSVNKIVPLNQGVITVAAVANLPTTGIEVGYFYYATEENVLCVYNGSKWVQINPDTNTTITARTMTATKATGATALQVTDTLTASDNKSWSAYWGFEETGGNVTVTVNKVKEDTIERNMFTIKCNVALGTDASTTIGIIKLTDSGDNNKKVIIKPKDTNTKLTVASDDSGNISIDDAALRNADIESITHSISTAGDIKTTITRNGNKSLSATFTPIIEYGSSSETKQTAKFESTLDTSDTGTAKLDVYTTGQVDDLIEKAKAEMDAMTYMGTLDGSKPLPTGTATSTTDTYNLVCVGDTWKIATSAKRYTRDGEYADIEGELPTEGAEWAQKGDLFIARGTEDAETGYITSNLSWDHVPSGDDTSTNYTTLLNDYGFTINESGASNAKLVQFDVAAGTAILLGTDKPASGTETDKTRSVTINHANVTRSADATAAAVTQSKADLTDYVTTNSFTHVKSVATNDQGHVTQVTNQTVTLTDTNASLKEVDLSVANATGTTNAVTLTSKVTLQHPVNTNDATDSKNDSITIKSMNSNLSVSVDSDAIALNLVWGTF